MLKQRQIGIPQEWMYRIDLLIIVHDRTGRNALFFRLRTMMLREIFMMTAIGKIMRIRMKKIGE